MSLSGAAVEPETCPLGERVNLRVLWGRNGGQAEHFETFFARQAPKHPPSNRGMMEQKGFPWHTNNDPWFLSTSNMWPRHRERSEAGL